MNLLVTGAWAGALETLPQIEKMGHKVLYMPSEKEGLACDPAWVEGVVCNGLFLYHPIEGFSNLRYIQLTSAGFDRVPMEYVRAQGIEIHNARGVYSIPMAEYAVCGVLQLYKQMPFFYENQKAHKWEKHRGLRELYGKTVCIVGCGSVGTECAKRFAAFGCRVVGVDLSQREDKHYSRIVPAKQMSRALAAADIIIITIPLNRKTRHLIDAGCFSVMKPEAILVSISRGEVVDTEALTTALQSHSIAGAVLDVFEEEPLGKESPLWGRENVVITPHNSFVGEQNTNRLSDRILGNLLKEKERQ